MLLVSVKRRQLQHSKHIQPTVIGKLLCVWQAPNSALGFRVTVSKWLILVRLLLGEIPEHQDFTQPGLRKPLQAYYELTQAVRGGDLTLFR